jgi:hypothetical protein
MLNYALDPLDPLRAHELNDMLYPIGLRKIDLAVALAGEQLGIKFGDRTLANQHQPIAARSILAHQCETDRVRRASDQRGRN